MKSCMISNRINIQILTLYIDLETWKIQRIGKNRKNRKVINLSRINVAWLFYRNFHSRKIFFGKKNHIFSLLLSEINISGVRRDSVNVIFSYGFHVNQFHLILFIVWVPNCIKPSLFSIRKNDWIWPVVILTDTNGQKLMRNLYLIETFPLLKFDDVFKNLLTPFKFYTKQSFIHFLFLYIF